ARISAFLISFGSLLYFRSPGPFFSSLKTILNEARNHPSPNSGWPESAMAGALGIRVSGPQYYGGKLYMKPYIRMDIREISPARIKEALHIMLLAS
ncbi:cobalamin biosynthesis protein, partial [Escherichia coli]|nr:cobalamin biosynthesis protein [Escherichia coli]